LAWLSPFVLPFLGLILTSVLIFGVNRATGPSFVFYESSVYESRSYNSERGIETIRRESFRSNIPGLVDATKQDASLLPLRPPAAELEDEIEQEVRDMIRAQERMFGEFF
jgi:hypothetical protein